MYLIYMIYIPPLGQILKASGVDMGESRDHLGQPRFFPFVPGDLVTPSKKDPSYWYWNNIAHDHFQVFFYFHKTNIQLILENRVKSKKMLNGIFFRA